MILGFHCQNWHSEIQPSLLALPCSLHFYFLPLLLFALNMSEMSTNVQISPSIQNFNQTVTHSSAGEYQNLQTSFRPKGQNYLVWSQLVKTFLKWKGKLSHLVGLVPSPKDPRFATWDEEDSMLMSWLWNSVHSEISGTCMFLTTMKEIWEFLKQSYFNIQDAEREWELGEKLVAPGEEEAVLWWSPNLSRFWLRSWEESWKGAYGRDAKVSPLGLDSGRRAYGAYWME